MEFWKAYFRVPASMIVWVMETFAANRARLAAFIAQPKVATALKVLFIGTLLIWLAIAFFVADDEAGRRFTDWFKEQVPYTKDWEIMN